MSKLRSLPSQKPDLEGEVTYFRGIDQSLPESVIRLACNLFSQLSSTPAVGAKTRRQQLCLSLYHRPMFFHPAHFPILCKIFSRLLVRCHHLKIKSEKESTNRTQDKMSCLRHLARCVSPDIPPATVYWGNDPEQSLSSTAPANNRSVQHKLRLLIPTLPNWLIAKKVCLRGYGNFVWRLESVYTCNRPFFCGRDREMGENASAMPIMGFCDRGRCSKNSFVFSAGLDL